MKHLLNNLSEQEKNNIREQYSGGIKINTDKFKRLVETKLGDVKLYLNEETKKSPTIMNVRVWLNKDMTGKRFYDLELKGNTKNSGNVVAIKGDIVNAPTGDLISEEAFLRYNCDKKTYHIQGIGEYGNYLNHAAYLSDKEKKGLNMVTWCDTQE